MSIPTVDEEVALAIDELNKLAAYGRQVRISKKAILDLVPKLDKLELMILDSAFKELDLGRLRNIILVLPEPYLAMLHNVIKCLIVATERFINQPPSPKPVKIK